MIQDDPHLEVERTIITVDQKIVLIIFDKIRKCFEQAEHILTNKARNVLLINKYRLTNRLIKLCTLIV